MFIYPNAKINIGLNIISKTSDGFHNIESITTSKAREYNNPVFFAYQLKFEKY